MTVTAFDPAGNASRASREILIDNTPPGQALDARVDGGDGWRAHNGFKIGWRNPAQNAAPIAAVRYLLCPASNASDDEQGCVAGSARGSDINSIPNLRVPRPGEWALKLWLEDEAGNTDRQRSVQVGVLRFDDDIPTLAFAPMDDQDPTHIRVVAKDATSGVADGQIEVRRDGEDAWRALPTRVDAGGLSTNIDDETLPKGRYTLRARVVDRAGNERSTQSLSNGDPASRTLPLRIATRLTAGKPQRILARNAKGKRRYRTVLRVNPSTRYGGTIPLSGRLTMPGGNPLAGADVEVWERTKLPSSNWRQVSVLRTSRTGRFRFKALRGPSRTLRFRFPGTANDPLALHRGRSRCPREYLLPREPQSRRQRRGGPFPRSPPRAPGRRDRQALAPAGVHARPLVDVRDASRRPLQRPVERALPVQRDAWSRPLPIPGVDPTGDDVPL